MMSHEEDGGGLSVLSVVMAIEGVSCPYLADVQRLVAGVLLQDEELVPHPAPPPSLHPLLGVDAPRRF